jgi:hypothetical protein
MIKIYQPLPLHPELHKQIKIYAANEGLSMIAFLKFLIVNYEKSLERE